ncbi:carbon starvation CstA family protein, partial [Citrobacter freundii]|uniref:carbon starvation CstA family protein n=1 Tax=Citrobacter freundii TaxID=546 RepID=UPI001F49E8F8
PWGVFTVCSTVPIALFMGIYMRFIRPGRVVEVSVIGIVLLVASIYFGGVIAHDPYWGPAESQTARSTDDTGNQRVGFFQERDEVTQQVLQHKAA